MVNIPKIENPRVMLAAIPLIPKPDTPRIMPTNVATLRDNRRFIVLIGFTSIASVIDRNME